jgi:LmbE family N-acetylglucosaminyl deacetylase
MKTVYFSPHLDDAIFSCGGIIAQQVLNGHKVEVWSFFTSDPVVEGLTPFARILHRQWGKTQNPYQTRRGEDIAACRLLSVNWRHFGYPDCIYRRYPKTGAPLVRNKADLFKPGRERETDLIGAIKQNIDQNLAPQDTLVIPLGVGTHIDHLLIHEIAISYPNMKFFYPDYPYAGTLQSIMELGLPEGAKKWEYHLTGENLSRWQSAAGCYSSQVSSFWDSIASMEQDIARYAVSPVGNTLWSY